MNYELNGEDVLRLAENKANLLTYRELAQYNTIDSLLKDGACIILYETSTNEGHWCCIFKYHNRYEFFDSYGLKPDAQFEYIPENFRQVSNQIYPHLTYLLYHSPKKYKIEYNQYNLQRMDPSINTCGRMVGLRLFFRFLNIDQFNELMRSQEPRMTPDQFAVYLTSDI